jgi:hypothetical protein
MTEVLTDRDAGASTRSGDVERRLSGAWRRELRFVLARGFCRLLIWLAALLAADFLLDWQIDLPGRIRMLLAGVNVAVLLVVAYLDLVRYLKRFDPLRVALQVETLHPHLQSLLVSYVQLHDRPEGHEGISPALIRAMCRQARQKVQPLDFGKIVRFRALRGLFLLCVAVVGIEAAAGAWRPDFLRVFLARMTDPACRLKYPTQTIIDSVTPGDDDPQQGARVELTVTVRGKLPDQATIFIQQEASDRESIRLSPAKAEDPSATQPETASRPAGPPRRKFTYAIERTTRRFDYWFKAGDAVSDRYTIAVVPPPRIRAAVKASYPEYTRQLPRMAELAGLEVLEGTRLEWRLEFDRPVTTVNMECTPETGAAIDVSADGRTGRSKAPVVADKAFSYGFQVTDREHGYTYASDVSHTVSVKGDEPPTIELHATSDPPVGTVDKTVTLSYEAADEYGLAKARIIWWRVDPTSKVPKEQVWAMKDFPNQPLRTIEKYEWEVKKAIPDLKPGDVIEYTVEAVDNRKVGPLAGNTRRSEKRRLEVVSDEEYDRRADEQRKALLDGIKDLREIEGDAAPNVQRLAEQVTGRGSTSRPSTRPASGTEKR